jgi:hypothetical protein
MSDYLLGIDPGQATDPTALVLLEHDRQRQPTYRLCALHRFPLGTPYTQLPAAINKRLSAEPLIGRTRLTVDATGVGAPVIDLFKQEFPRIQLYAITITGGNTVTGSPHEPHVPKRDLIATTSVILEQHRLGIPTTLPSKEALIDELLNYRHTISDTGHDSYAAAAGSHDDLLLALSLALWTAEHKPLHYPTSKSQVPRARLPSTDEWLNAQLRRHNSL